MRFIPRVLRIGGLNATVALLAVHLRVFVVDPVVPYLLVVVGVLVYLVCTRRTINVVALANVIERIPTRESIRVKLPIFESWKSR
jgi:hypothetical protein